MSFKNLNRASPKDSFPLSRINQLVDFTAGHELLTFMDAFSGYNQILISKEDQKKTPLVTSQGVYCYKVMPFGLKNVGTTCQRLVNHMSSKQIDKNVEVYVDNMLVKGRDEVPKDGEIVICFAHRFEEASSILSNSCHHCNDRPTH